VASLGEGKGRARVEPIQGVTPLCKGGEGGSGDDDYKSHHFFEERNRATPSVTAPGDTNLSDATAPDSADLTCRAKFRNDMN